MDELKFEWDENKNLLNQRKHGVDFETAAFVFEDEYHVATKREVEIYYDQNLHY